MQKIEIASGIWYKDEIDGTFPLIAKFKADASASKKSEERLKRNGYVWIEAGFGNDGITKKTRVAVNEEDINIVGRHDNVMTDEDIEQEIEDRFDVMDILTKGVINRTIKGVIVAGASGIGKTFGIDKLLKKAMKEEKITKLSTMSGSCSPIGLYLTLFAHQNAGNVLVMDDIDSIFDDQESLNLLKKALDTTDEREITWMKDSAALDRESVDRSFMFNGSIIFITNHNFDNLIDKGGKMSVHYEALISRCMYLDLGIHTMKEVVVRVKQVVRKSDMMEKLGHTQEEIQMMLDWLMLNLEGLRKVDLRTMIKLSQAWNASPSGWQKIAKASLCKR